jgi:hypothetical protein
MGDVDGVGEELAPTVDVGGEGRVVVDADPPSRGKPQAATKTDSASIVITWIIVRAVIRRPILAPRF